MEQDLTNAIGLLNGSSYTCVLCKDDRVLTTRKRGVAYLLELLDSGQDVSGFSAADRVVGKGAAYLYVLLGVRTVYAPVMSQGAASLLQSHGIPALYEKCPPHIINRAGDGICPIEQTVWDCETPEEALAAIRSKLRQLRSAAE